MSSSSSSSSLPPTDAEQRHIIDKLAQFVARNGPEFEQMTKTKQKDNPKFAFLFGGSHVQYYKYRVAAEQALLRAKNLGYNEPPPPPTSTGTPLTSYQQPPPTSRPPPNYWPPQQGQSQHDQAPLLGQLQGQPPPSGQPPVQQQPPPSLGQQMGQPHPHVVQQGQPPPHLAQHRGEAPSHLQQLAQPPPKVIGQHQGQQAHHGIPPHLTQQQHVDYPQPYSQPPLQQEQQPLGYHSGNGSSSRDQSWSAPRPLMALEPFGPSLQSELDSLCDQQKRLRDQIDQSERNLAAQEAVKESEERRRRDDIIKRGQREDLERLASSLRIDVEELDMVMNPIVLSCTKDSISSGKSWIFSSSVSHEHNRLISTYLCHRVTDPESSFTTRLHLIYLMNDVLHHCTRKNADELKNSLESVAPEMFCAAHLQADTDQKKKLEKLINLWETKGLFSVSTLSKMRNVEATWASFRRRLIEDYAEQIELETTQSRQLLDKYRQQHLAFVSHANGTIKNLEQQRIQLEQKGGGVSGTNNQQNVNSSSGPPNAEILKTQPKTSRWDNSGSSNNQTNEAHAWHQPTSVLGQESEVKADVSTGSASIPDLSRPPPSLLSNEIPPSNATPEALAPTMPYYDLPAGLIMSVIKLEDSGYKPVDPDKLRLPPPVPPSEALLQAVELFYAPPSHERPRNAEGWEKTGLYEWSRDKAAAVKEKEDAIERGDREKSMSPSPEPSLSLPTEDWDEMKTSRSPPKSDIKPKKRYREEVSLPSSSSSRIARRSPSPPSSRRRSPGEERRRRRDSNNDPPRGSRSSSSRRSPSPRGNTNRHGERLDASNKGHQMLERMGWRGSGLGSSESGIVEPIRGGEVRDRNNMYKGVGVDAPPDAFEMYRRQRSGSFITRMRERAADVSK